MNFIKDFIFAGILAVSFSAAFANTPAITQALPAPVWQMSTENCVATTHLLFQDSSVPAEMRVGIYEDAATGFKILSLGLQHQDFTFPQPNSQQVLFSIGSEPFVGELNIVGPSALIFVITHDARLLAAFAAEENIVVRNIEDQVVIDFQVRGIRNAIRRVEGCKYGRRT